MKLSKSVCFSIRTGTSVHFHRILINFKGLNHNATDQPRIDYSILYMQSSLPYITQCKFIGFPLRRLEDAKFSIKAQKVNIYI